MISYRYGLLALLGLLLFTGPARAQEAAVDDQELVAMKEDSTTTPDRLPLQHTDPSPSTILTHQPGVFAWTFGAAGWPDAPAPFGTDPNRVQLRWDGQSVDDLLTGRPRYDLVPVGLAQVGNWLSDGSAGFKADPLETQTPETRIRYASASDGLQGIYSVHVQNRSFGTDSTRSRLQTVFGYAGAGASGEYSGSRLRRAREIAFRIRWETTRYTIQLDEVAIRRSIGAHTGVEPFGTDPESIYQRLGAIVGDESARRRTIRNDLRLRGDTRVRGIETRLNLERHSQTHDFTGESLAMRSIMTRWKGSFEQNKDVRAVDLSWSAFHQRDIANKGSAWTELPKARSLSGATLSGIWQRRSATIRVKAGPRVDENRTWVDTELHATKKIGTLSLRSSALQTGRRLSLMESAGMGDLASRVLSHEGTDLRRLQLGADWRHRWLSVYVDGMIQTETDPIVHQLDPDGYSLSTTALRGAQRTSAVSVIIGIRDDAQRGLYARLNPVFRKAKANNSEIVQTLWERAAPDSWLSARFGVRALLFKSDLDLDAFVRVRGWNGMSGRRLHSVTGLLVLPSDGADVDSDWMVDLVAEGGVRGATLFLALENVLSGTNLQIGNLLVPDYPLPQQRLRFGVYWPIKN
ncbi:MAG: hypothetical protein O3A57_10740 [Bacteroidetes bacterium]|nr:hypothetical protein [Bacteroidota bacterium]